MKMLNENDIATAYLLKLPKHFSRNEALARCAEHLAVHHDISTDTAKLDALRALAELESINQNAFIDADLTTAHVVVIRRPGQLPLAFTVSDLLRLHAREKTCPAPADTH